MEAAIIALQLFVDRLNAHSKLSYCDESQILALPAQLVSVPARRDLVPIHGITSYSSLVASGLMARFNQTRDGSRQITAFNLPGDVANLHSAVRPIGAGGVTTLTNCTVVQIPNGAIRNMTESHPAIAEALWRDCMLDTAIVSQWILSIGRRDARGRLAHIFCEMAVRTGRNDIPALSYRFPVIQEHLGDALSITSVHVNRTLKAMREQNVVSLRNGQVHIYDWERLVRLAEFDACYLVGNKIVTPPSERTASAI